MAKPDIRPRDDGAADRKLESWKEIAVFFERDERTVKRWEKELALPVHRYPGKTKGRVYAHVSELTAWAEAPRRSIAEAGRPPLTTPTEVDTRLDIASGGAAESLEANREARRRLARWFAAIGVLAALALTGYGLSHLHRDASIHSVAVLPFENLGGKSDPAFVEGLTDEVATSLSRLDGMRVVGRSSTYALRGRHDDLLQIGSALNVETVVEGSVQRSGDRTHVAVQLNRTRDGFTIWAQTFDVNSEDPMPVESEIAAAVARTLSVNSAGSMVARSATDPQARALYLQGRYLWNQRNFEAEKKSVEFMRQAIAKDPNYAQAWSGLADSLMTIANLEFVRPSAYIPEARQAARKALELDPYLADAHAVLGRIAAHYDYDWPAAESEYKKAFALNPSYATAHQYYALGLMAHGRFAEAQRELDIARELDPLALVVGVDIALLNKFGRDYDGTIREAQRVLQLDPNYHTGISMLATGYYMSHRWDEWRKLAETVPQDPSTEAMVAGRRDEAKRLLMEEEQRAEQGAVPASAVAFAAIRVGDYKTALTWLERSYQNHEYWVLFINADPEMDPVRSDPQFQAIVKRLGVG